MRTLLVIARHILNKWPGRCNWEEKVRTSVPKDRCVIATSSKRMLNSVARCVRLSRTCECIPTWCESLRLAKAEGQDEKQ